MLDFNFRNNLKKAGRLNRKDVSLTVKSPISLGQTSKNVILVADSQSPQLNKTEAFYVAMSRGTHNAKIYTDDVESLKTQFKEAQEKTSTRAQHRRVISAPGVKTKSLKNNREPGRSK